MIQDTTEFLMTVSAIVTELAYSDTESKMMCINGLMTGHGVTWKPIGAVLTAAVKESPNPIIKAELGTFISMQDYFIHQVNSGFFGPFTYLDDVKRMCGMCMDFTILEAGNRVNMMVNDGPY